MVASIPASEIVNILPNVIGAGGNALDLSGLVLTTSTRVPVGTVVSFASLAAVSAYFGPAAAEAAFATIYFRGYDGATQTPGAILFAQYPTAPVAAYLRGGSLAGMTLTQLQALTGTLSVTVDGGTKTSSAINLSSATSFSAAAALIQAGFTSPGFTVSYDSVANAFVFTDATTGASSAVSVATGSLAAPLALTSATGAVISLGAVASAPATAMEAVVAQTQNFATFTTLFKPTITDMVAFATWNTGKNSRYAYIAWDNDAAPTTASDTTSFGYLARQANLAGYVPLYDPATTKAPFVMGSAAAIDFNQANGRVNFAFLSQTGLTADVTNQVIAENLLANGYDFYGSYATANQAFTFLYDGQLGGPFSWLDSYINQIWLNNQLQLALMSFLVAIKNVPYNVGGYGSIETAMLGPVTTAVSFGAIQTGVELSALQVLEVNTQAGRKIDDVLFSQGWYILVADPGTQVRGSRGSPTIILFYTDGGSVQALNVSSVLVS